MSGLYRRLDEWTRARSRLEYALLAGVITAMTALAVGAVLGEPTAVKAVTLGATMTVVYYAFDPNRTG
ncbi:hypothetical protein [Halorussus marinus]|uniref:hypothetical protein n=1 Tax=Halorussus marinus TaxID=2505976 RepID=UPI00106E0FDC|nr:hypothetical protein [Halorussus marinus]